MSNNDQNIKEEARAATREILMMSQSFKNMPVEEQRNVYKSVLEEQMARLRGEPDNGVSREMRIRKSSDLLDDDRHDRSFDEGVEGFEDLVDSVDFPKFVADLLNAVFTANINVMKSQTDDYIRLMKEATTGLATFIKKIDDTTTFAYLAENNSDEFNISMESDGEGGEKLALTDPQGEPVDIGDNEVKAKIMDAKIKMAQEHRGALREMLLMGITRLVVEKGEIEAEVNFEFKGKRSVNKEDKALLRTSKNRQFNKSYIGRIVPITPFGADRSQTELSVSSTKSSAQDELSAKLRGFVNIQFKTDYFKLDNFANMYGPASKEDKEAAAPK